MAVCDGCVETGFNINYVLSDSYFYGDNNDSILVTVTYEGFNTTLISMYYYENTGN